MPYVSLDPATNRIIKSFPSWDAQQLAKALESSHRAQAEWKNVSFGERARIMQRVGGMLREEADRYAGLITQEMGKLAREAKSEVEKCALVCEYYALDAELFLQDEMVESDAGKSYVGYFPLGTVLAVMPWNFPFWQVFRAVAPALMAGNAVVLKHASNVPQCALAIEELFRSAGLPEHLFTTLMIDADMVSEAIASPMVHALTLTGSEEAGRKVAAVAGQHLKKCVLELGGSDAFIVLRDADLEYTVSMAVLSRFQNCGQSCIAAKRFIVVPEIADEFVDMLKSRVEALRVGDPRDESSQIGPMARLDLRDGLHRQVMESIAEGAVAVTGCEPIDGEGAYYKPSILDRVGPGMPAYHEELFGPVASVIRAEDEADAIRIANDSRFGLGSSLWSRAAERAERLSREIQAGCTFINGIVKSDPRLPFGGIKDSGFGRELSYHGIREFVNAKTVWIRRVRAAPRS